MKGRVMTTAAKIPISGICAQCQATRAVRGDGMLVKHSDRRSFLHTPECEGAGKPPAIYVYTIRATPHERQIIIDALDYYASNALLQADRTIAQSIAASFDRSRQHVTEDDIE